MLLVTAVMAATRRDGIDFFLLTCDYEEKLYAAGKIPGGFIRREGRPSEQAILNSRLIDRPIRPFFPKDFRNDVQVVATVLSVDQDAVPATMAINGASLALSISPIPFQGPIGAVRIGMLDDQLVVGPPINRLAESKLDLVVAGTREAIIMVEAGAKEVPEETIVEALRLAHREIVRICEMQDAFAREVGKPKVAVAEGPKDPEIDQAIDQFLAQRLDQAIFNPNKALRESALDDLKKETVAELGPQFAERLPYLAKSFDAKVKQRVRNKILDEGTRPDGRKTTEIRPITCEVGILPRTHGSALFTRGQVAGIAMGLIAGDGKVAVLSDIQGVEDALGDMDFKVAGTRTGVTAMQMDMKIKGISIDTMAGAIQQAKEGRFFIMDKMDAALSQPRSAMSQYAPRMITVQIHPDKIREVIGPGGKMIRKIIEDSGVTSIDIEDDGRGVIGPANGEAAAKG